MNLVAIDVAPREPPLDPVAAIARDRAAVALARKLLARSDDALAALRGVAGRGLIVVLGDALPWVDGIVYLGRDPAAPGLLVPTTLSTTVPIATVERALLRAFGAERPLAMLLREGLVVPCAGAMPIARSVLERWLAEESS